MANHSSNPRGPDGSSDTGGVPEAVVKPRGRWLPSLVWVVPIVAALVGVSLIVRTINARGPTITITFASADGLEAGKTKVKFKDVEIGTAKSIVLSKDRQKVQVAIELTKDATDFAVADSKFWVVRPRIAASGVSGLGTLLSGAYIGVDRGHAKDVELKFVGMETPPPITTDQKGSRFVLHGDSLGSLDIGSPIYYRRVPVGQITSFSLDPGGVGVTLGVFVSAPYDRYVFNDTRWWHASGVDLQLDASGFKLNTQSLATIVLGGLSFQTPPNQNLTVPAPSNASFQLASTEAEAMKPKDGPARFAVMNFTQSLRGLSVGAPIDFRGIVLGTVTGISVEYDPTTRGFVMPVTMTIYPGRLGSTFRKLVQGAGGSEGQHLLQVLVARGLRAQLRTGNLLTGQIYVALDFFPHAAPVKVDVTADVFDMPTVPNTLDELQTQIASVAKKLDKIPFDQIGNNVNAVLLNANSLFKQLDSQVAPEARDTLIAAKKTFGQAEITLQQDSPMQTDVHQALQELTRTLQSLNALSDYLERHPESLLRGKGSDKP